MARLQSVVGPIPESVMTVAFGQQPLPDNVLVHEADDTVLDIREGLDVIEEGHEIVCDGFDSVLVGSSSESFGSCGFAGGPSGDGV